MLSLGDKHPGVRREDPGGRNSSSRCVRDCSHQVIWCGGLAVNHGDYSEDTKMTWCGIQTLPESVTIPLLILRY
jgi:hypothetical protein